MLRLLVPAVALGLAACAVPPAASPALAPATASSGLPKYTVFFTEWSGRFDDPALGTISTAAAAAKSNPTVPVVVAGFADTVGSNEANKDISQLRAQLVMDQLVADGVPAARISIAAHGGTNFIASSQESRRVVISVGAP